MINKIIDETGVKIDIEDDGRVIISTTDEAAGAKAREMIESIVKEVEVGEIYFGKVVRIMNFGAFVELIPEKTHGTYFTPSRASCKESRRRSENRRPYIGQSNRNRFAEQGKPFTQRPHRRRKEDEGRNEK